EMNHYESANRLNHRAHMFPGGVIRRNWSANCNAPIFGDLRSDVSNAVNVEVSMLPGKTEFRRKMLTNQISVQKCHWSAADFEKFGDQYAGNSRFTGA